MKNRKCLALCAVMAASLGAASITGCSTAKTETTKAETIKETEETAAMQENSFTYDDAAQSAPAGETVTGKVQGVNGNRISLEIMLGMPDGGQQPSAQQPGGEQPGGQQPGGEQPSGQPGGEQPGGQQPGGEQPSGQPGGEQPGGQQPGDQQPSGQPGGEQPSGEQPGDFSADLKTALLVVGEESVITTTKASETKNGTLADITEGSVISIVFDEDGSITAIQVSSGMAAQMGGGMGQSQAPEAYQAAAVLDQDTQTEGETYSSDGEDENAILIKNGAEVSLKNAQINRDAGESSGGDSASFYGVGAAVLAEDGTASIADSKIHTTGNGAAGVFAYGSGIASVSDTEISTTGNTAGGIHVAGGGTLYAKSLNVTTQGESSAAIRSDRGGGTMIVDGGSYVSNGVGSPAIYCTADIAVNQSELTANGSEAICMEGKNKLHLYGCNITGNMKDLETNDTTWNIIVYQSMSGDSEVGTGELQLNGGSLTAKNGGMIYTTNTDADIYMSDVAITYPEECEYFLRCTGNKNVRGWGTAGANGSDCNFTANRQEMQGKVIWDSISNLSFYMENGSILTGSIEQDESCAGNGGDGTCKVSISSDSKWIVTGDSKVTELDCAGTIVDEDGKTVSIVGSDGTVCVRGDSAFTITADSYSDQEEKGALEGADWSAYSSRMQ